VRAARYTVQPDAGQLREIDALIAADKVRPHVDRTFDIANVREAFAAIEQGHVAGKLVLDLATTITGVPDPE
jgi:NADPH:quinone reductase-like Zn-dependent oxidoreductase